jgi:superfamily I DNA and/or RNA helicase
MEYSKFREMIRETNKSFEDFCLKRGTITKRGKGRKSSVTNHNARSVLHCKLLEEKLMDETKKGNTRSKVSKELARRKIVFCTLCTAMSEDVRRQLFDYSIVDEAGQVTMMSYVLSLRAGMTRSLLFGDTKQNPPSMPFSPETRLHKLAGTAAMKYLEKYTNCQLTRIHVQYRCHPHIARALRDFYYGHEIEDGRPVDSFVRYLDGLREKLPVRTGVGESPRLQLMHIEDPWRREKDVEENKAEAHWILTVLQKVDHLIPAGEKRRILIMSGYRKQVRLISLMTQAQRWENVDIAVTTIDDAQGSEAHIVILSLVRQNSLGFLGGRPYRPLVACSRACEYLFIVGNIKLFCQDSSWRQIFQRSASEKDLKNICGSRWCRHWSREYLDIHSRSSWPGMSPG